MVSSFFLKKMQSKSTKDLELLAKFLDSQFIGPFNIKIGFDSIIGLLPFIGDSIGAILASYIIIRSAMLGASKSLLLHMAGNALIDYIIGLIPFFGDVFDIFWKSNQRNINLLKAYLETPEQVTTNTQQFITTTIILTLAALIFALWFSVTMAKILF